MIIAIAYCYCLGIAYCYVVLRLLLPIAIAKQGGVGGGTAPPHLC